MSKRILLLDLDTPCFAAASVAEERTVLVTHVPTGKQKVFKNRTEFKDRLKEKEAFNKLSEYLFEDKQEAEPVSHACVILKNIVSKIEEAVESDETWFFISGKDNFRDSLPLPTKYKSSRAGTIRPLLLTDVKQFAINKYKAEICHFDEPDDRIIYRAYELKAKGFTPIIATIDKDALAYSGLLIYNQDKPEQGIVEIPQLGSLWMDDKKTLRGNGFLWYCAQVTKGDITDSFKPSELAKVKFGDASAYKLLKDCKTEQEALLKVVQQYKEWYPEPFEYTAWDGRAFHDTTWLDVYQMYHRCCRMKAHEFDGLYVVEFAKQYGVQL
jgi:hypothetical protein